MRGTFSEAGGCACSLLAEDADWAAPIWPMRPEILEPLAHTLVVVGEAIPDGFTVAALWTGDAPNCEQIVSLNELITIAREGRLATDTFYRVTPQAGNR